MKICVMTLGCKVNKYESDALIENLDLRGYETTDKLEPADIYIVNTCAVTSEAEKKSRQMLARCRKLNKHAKFFICGCASQKNADQFVSKDVQVVCGAAGKMKICEYIDNLSKNHEKTDKNIKKIEKLPEEYEDDLLAKQSRIRAYIKIQDGCNNFCTYCIIPYLRGRSRSRGIFSIINEAGRLGDDVKEIVLTGIDVTDYKIDGEKGLLTLLTELDKFGKRLRLSSVEDTLVDDTFVQGLKNLDNFCPHFHLSLQSGSESVLKRMNRHYKAEDFEKSVNLIRKYFPDAGITTDVIVGFPDETDEEFDKTYQFIKKIKFSQLHIFQYSKREGTVAAKLYKDLPPQIKQKRAEKLEELNKVLKKQFVKRNKWGNVLVEEKIDGYYVGYTQNYVRCYIKSKTDLTNQIVFVRVGRPFKDGAKAKVRKSKNKHC